MYVKDIRQIKNVLLILKNSFTHTSMETCDKSATIHENNHRQDQSNDKRSYVTRNCR